MHYKDIIFGKNYLFWTLRGWFKIVWFSLKNRDMIIDFVFYLYGNLKFSDVMSRDIRTKFAVPSTWGLILRYSLTCTRMVKILEERKGGVQFCSLLLLDWVPVGSFSIPIEWNIFLPPTTSELGGKFGKRAILHHFSLEATTGEINLSKGGCCFYNFLWRRLWRVSSV